MKLLFILLVLMSALSQPAMAEPTWSSPAAITSIQVIDTNNNPRITVSFDASPHRTPCSGGSSWWSILYKAESANTKNLYSLAASALLAGRSVKVLWDSAATNRCTDSKDSGIPTVFGLELD